MELEGNFLCSPFSCPLTHHPIILHRRSFFQILVFFSTRAHQTLIVRLSCTLVWCCFVASQTAHTRNPPGVCMHSSIRCVELANRLNAENASLFFM